LIATGLFYHVQGLEAAGERLAAAIAHHYHIFDPAA
jgi:hypothetical protein